jgi:hypothetical protein
LADVLYLGDHLRAVLHSGKYGNVSMYCPFQQQASLLPYSVLSNLSQMLKVLVHLTQSSDATSDVDRNCLLTARKEENQIHASVQN